MYIVLGHDGSLQVAIYGTPKSGRPFSSENAATRFMHKLEAVLPNARFLVVPILADDLSGLLTVDEREVS